MKESVCESKPIHEQPELSDEEMKQIQDDINKGNKLQAVKHYKEMAHCSLQEAKDFVDTHTPTK